MGRCVKSRHARESVVQAGIDKWENMWNLSLGENGAWFVAHPVAWFPKRIFLVSSWWVLVTPLWSLSPLGLYFPWVILTPRCYQQTLFPWISSDASAVSDACCSDWPAQWPRNCPRIKVRGGGSVTAVSLQVLQLLSYDYQSPNKQHQTHAPINIPDNPTRVCEVSLRHWACDNSTPLFSVCLPLCFDGFSCLSLSHSLCLV